MRALLSKNFFNYALIALLVSLLISPILEARLSPHYFIFTATLFGGLLGASRLNIIFIFTVWILAICYAATCLTPLVKQLAPTFITRDPLPLKADAVVVLSAESPLKNIIKAQGLERLIHGMMLIKEGIAPTLVLTDQPWFRGDPIKDRSLLLGEFYKNSLSIGPVENTFDEAKAVRKLAVEKGWKQIILVTSPLHSRRAKAIFREQLPEYIIISSPAEAREFDLELLVSSYDKLKAARLMFYEIAAWGKNLILGRL